MRPHDLNELLDVVRSSLGELIEADSLYVALADAENPAIFTLPYWVDTRDGPAPDAQFARSKTRTARVMETGRTLLLTAQETETLVESGELELQGLLGVAWLGVPLIVNNEAIGVLAIRSDDEAARYTERDVEIMEFVAGQIAVAIDRQRVRRELVEERRLFQILMDHVPDQIYFKDREHRFLRVNSAVVSKFEMEDSGAVVGKTDFDLLPESYALGYQAQERAILETGKPVSGNVGRHDGEYGQTVWTHVTKVPFRDSEGRIDGLVGIHRDITKLIETQEELRKSEARLRAIMDAAADGIITIDHRGIIASLNPAACEMFGYDAPELIGQDVNMLMPEPYASGHGGYIDNYLRTGDAKIIGLRREVEGMRKDGATFTMDLSIGEVDVGGQRFFTGIVRDITERKALQDGLASLNAELEQRVEERTAALEREVAEHRATTARVQEQANELEHLVRSARCILWRSRVEERDGWYEWTPLRRDAEQFQAFLRLEIRAGEDYHDAWRRSIPVEDVQRIDEMGRHAIQKGHSGYAVEHRVVDAAGVTHWLRDEASIEATGDRQWQVIGVLTNITAQKEDELLRSTLYEIAEAGHTAPDLDTIYHEIHALLAKLLNMTGLAVTLLDADDLDEIASVYWTGDDLEGRGFKDLRIPRSRTARVARTGQALYLTADQSRELADSGEIELYGSNASAWLGAPLIVDGQVIGVVRVAHDSDPDPYTAGDVEVITYAAQQIATAIDRKHTQTLLAQEQSLFQALMDHAPDAIYFKDTESTFLRVNNICAALLGFENAADLVGLTDDDIDPGSKSRRFRAEEKELMRTGEAIMGQIHDDMPGLWVSATKAALRDEQGAIVGLVGVNRNVTGLEPISISGLCFESVPDAGPDESARELQ